MLAFSIDYYGIIFKATQSVELFCTYVAICRALINEPKVILADEPTGNLDTFNTELILEILLRIKIELKKTIILVTHDKGICKFADRIIEMKNGKLQEQNIK